MKIMDSGNVEDHDYETGQDEGEEGDDEVVDELLEEMEMGKERRIEDNDWYNDDGSDDQFHEGEVVIWNDGMMTWEKQWHLRIQSLFSVGRQIWHIQHQ